MNRDFEKHEEQYIHHSSYKHRERMVGFFVFFGFVLLLGFILISVKNQHLLESRVTFYIEVASSEGINPGSIVTLLSEEVGVVASLRRAQDHRILVAIDVYEGQHKRIRKGAKVIINRLTTIGSALIEIQSDSIDAPVLVDGSTIPVEETPSLNDLLLSIASLIQSADNNNLLNSFETIFPKVEETLENIHQIIAQIATGHGTLGAAVFDKTVEKDLKVVVTSGANILSEAEGIISIAKKRLIQLEPILVDAKLITNDMTGTVENLPEMMNELNDVILQVKTAMALVNGELANMPGVALDVRRTMTKTDQLLDGIQNTWPLSNSDLNPQGMQIIAPQP